jgi:glycosyltransferase involved in cell wall biosynthesis
MRVLIISATFPPMKSGGAHYAFHFAQNLAARGADVHVLTSQIADVELPEGVQVHPLMRDWSWSELPKVLRLARRLRPDVLNLHFNGLIYNSNPMITFALTPLKRMLKGTRAVTLIEYPTGIKLELNYSPAGFLNRAAALAFGTRDQEYGTLLHESDGVILLSDSHARLVKGQLELTTANWTVIPPPPLIKLAPEGLESRQRGRAALGLTDHEFVLMYFGYLYPQKGLETLFEALSLVAVRRNVVRLIIVGGSNEVMLKQFGRPNYAKELRDMTHRLGIEDAVIWTGYCANDTDEVSLYFRSADVCVLPFDAGVYLNNSTFTVAAMHGMPIVSTRPNQLDVGISDGENVILCPPREPQALATAIESILDDETLRLRLSRGALQLARQRLTWDKAMEQTLEIFEGPTTSVGA